MHDSDAGTVQLITPRHLFGDPAAVSLTLDVRRSADEEEAEVLATSGVVEPYGLPRFGYTPNDSLSLAASTA